MAGVYDAGRGLLPEAEAAWERVVARYVRAGSRVLDVGAGTGRFANLFRARFDAPVVAIEPAAGMRAQLRGRPGVQWVAGRAEAMPVRTGAFDIVWLCCVVHYLDLAATGREIARVLEPGGRALVRGVFPHRFDELTWMRWFPSARVIDEQRMPTVEAVSEQWKAAGLALDDRHDTQHRMADNLDDLADRLSLRAISTLELIGDDEFAAGVAALRDAAQRATPEPVYSTVDTLVFVHA